jgi:hypothetical protein
MDDSLTNDKKNVSNMFTHVVHERNFIEHSKMKVQRAETRKDKKVEMCGKQCPLRVQ